MNAKRPKENKPKTINKMIIQSCMCVLITQSCPTLCDPMDYSPPGSSLI